MANTDEVAAVACFAIRDPGHRRFAPPYFNLGNALAAGGNQKAALGVWDAGLRADPNHAAGFFALVVVRRSPRGSTRASEADGRRPALATVQSA